MQRGSVVVGSVVAIALGAAALVHVAQGRRLAAHPFELAPPGTTGVLRVSVPALLASPLWAAWFGDEDEGRRHIVEACGFDPLADLRTADVYVVGTRRRPLDQVGFVARGALRHEALVRCIERVTEGESLGGVHEDEIEGLPALASDHGSSRAVFLGADGVVGGDAEFVRDVVRRVRGEGASLLDDALLTELWQRAATDAEVVLAARIPDGWREGLERMVGEGGAWAPLASMRALGLGARVSRGFGATLAIELDAAGSARDLRGAIEDARDAALAQPLVRLSSVGGALRGLDVEADGPRLLVRADLDDDELAALVAVLRERLDGLLAGEPLAPAPTEAPRLPAPDETLAPSSGGAGVP
jgi:hypothetical protein